MRPYKVLDNAAEGTPVLVPSPAFSEANLAGPG